MRHAAVEKLPGVVKIVRDGSFLAVVAEREFQAIKAMHALAAAAKWEESREPAGAGRAAQGADQPAVAGHDHLRARAIRRSRAQKTIEATYTRPYQMHGSIGPSCAVAHFVDGAMTVWTHTPGRLSRSPGHRRDAAPAAGQRALIHVEGSGCYGHNGADDAAADAALIARALPGRPVRVQWMREQEHAWEPFGPAMVTKLKASLDGNGRIADWHYEVWSNTHSTRPGGAGSMLAAQHMAQPFARAAAEAAAAAGRRRRPQRDPALHAAERAGRASLHPGDAAAGVGAARARRLSQRVRDRELHGRAREAAGADPVEFRLSHLEDPRGRDVIETAAERFGWQSGQKAPPDRGRGFAFARYKNLAAYCAVAIEVEVDRETGRPRLVRAVAAVDSGQAVNPDGINQIEGGIVQSMSWTLYESVTFDDTRITSIDWRPIRSCASMRCPRASRCTSSTGRASRSSAPAKPRRARPRRRSPTPSPMPPASGCANCR